MRGVVLILVAAVAATASAQQLPAAADSAIARAVRLAAEKDSGGARQLLDSLTRSASPLVRGEATYQLSRIAASTADRERILGSLIIDHPFSPRLPAALFDLGMLELARNDRDRAATHLGRYLKSSSAPDSGRTTASLALGRLLLERGDLPRGCAALLVGRSEVPETAIELKNQFDFSIGRCHGVDTTTKTETKPPKDTIPASLRTGAFTVQVAAYDTKAAAQRLVTSLRSQGFEGRVVGTAKPYRVRVGRYATRADAEEASRQIDAKAKTKSLVVIVGPEER